MVILLSLNIRKIYIDK